MFYIKRFSFTPSTTADALTCTVSDEVGSILDLLTIDTKDADQRSFNL
ncbi:MAG: hypothetical protein ICV54_25815 [Nostoc sp. C3-bin3]|nr:hypothetical protein [Nostoc sp. C3-bin3]